jgi:putative aminopeptidase FrvX
MNHRENLEGACVQDRLTSDLLHATSLVSVPGRESAAIHFVRTWLQSLPGVEIRTDRFSQIHVRMNSEPPGHPMYWVAHLDHPGFIVELAPSNSSVNLVFRGSCDHLRSGLPESGHPPLAIRINTRSGPVRALIQAITAHGPSFTRVEATTEGPVEAGDIGFWEFPDAPKINEGRLHAPACDDLAGVCTVLSAFEHVATGPASAHPIRLLFTRAEELGLLGAIAVCKDRLLSSQSAIICIDAISDSAVHQVGPLNAPILIPADTMMTYSPRLVRHFAAVGGIVPASLCESGASEAGIFALSGFEALAIYFKVRNMHNCNPATPPGAPVHESVSIDQLMSLRDLLLLSARHPLEGPSLRTAVDAAWKEWSPILLRPP